VHTPEVNLALMCSTEGEAQLLCPFAEGLDGFRSSLSGLETWGGHGLSTRLGPMLRRAEGMFLARRGERRRGWASALEVECAVLVITDGLPSDLPEAAQAARSLRGVASQLIFADIGICGSCCDDNAGVSGMGRGLEGLAFARPVPPRRPRPTIARTPSEGEVPRRALEAPPWHTMLPSSADGSEAVFEVSTTLPTAAALQALVPRVLRQLLCLSRFVSRARCAMPLLPFQEQGRWSDEDDEDAGWEVALNDRVPLIDPTPIQWEHS